ncbi:MAG: penicillin acylase family protein [Bacteroidetes bacterium]|nr:MAG: penicillin acylase family protein [Bacteroidota bacterium]
MKNIKFGFSLLFCIAIFYALNTKFGSLPPLGKFLSPTEGFWQNEVSESNTNNTISINGLSASVSVKYDVHLIPHIFAQNELDLYKAQGYITAKHRLWQMEFQTHASAGRLSEIFGETALDYDRQERRRGMGFGADNTIEKMKEDPEMISYLEAYRDGVNNFINQLQPKDYPVEYKLLDYKPEPWTTKKTALLLMYMTKMLAGGDSDLEYTNALRKFGKERFDLLFPDFFDVNDPVIPAETDWTTMNAKITETPQSEFPLDSITTVLNKPHPNNGSNNWAISGAKSYSGNPILANDPHLGLKLPSVWYVMQLATPNHNSFGATLPGALGIISGFNTHISWGETNATRDVLDWYKIEFKDESMKQYKYDGSWKNTSVRVEEIKIRNKETFIDSVTYTHHGPITFDATFKGKSDKEGYAMKWAGHIGGNNQRTFIDLNKSKNYDDYLNALKHYVAPAQNFVFASIQGDIAIWIQGQFPNKWKGQGKFLMDGSNPENDWQSYIPKGHNAHVKNPKRGFVSSANQHPVDESYPYYVFNDGYETYRNRVINDFFSSKEKFNIQDFKDLHNNNYNLKASELLPYVFKNMDTSTLTTQEKEIYNQIKSWDFNTDFNQIAPSIWASWWSNIYNLTWDEFEVEELVLKKPFTYQTIYMLKNNPQDAFMDIVDTPEKETSKDLFLIAFKETVKELLAWQTEHGDYYWKNYKATFVGHLLQGLPAFSRFNIPIGGDANTVNAASKNHGPSWRMIVEMTSPPTALGIYPGGQSGNPGSKYYDNFIDQWADGKYLELDFIQEPEATKGILFTQILTPNNE